MSRKSNNFLKFWVIYILIFLLGILSCYVCVQWIYFKINIEINVIELLTNIATIVVGFYIAHTIQHQLNQKQNKYDFIIHKYDSIFDKFYNFQLQIRASKHISIATVAEYYKKTTFEISFLKTILSSLSMDPNILDDLQLEIDNLEKIIMKYNIKNNVINISDKFNLEFKLNTIQCKLGELLERFHKI